MPAEELAGRDGDLGAELVAGDEFAQQLYVERVPHQADHAALGHLEPIRSVAVPASYQRQAEHLKVMPIGFHTIDASHLLGRGT